MPCLDPSCAGTWPGQSRAGSLRHNVKGRSMHWCVHKQLLVDQPVQLLEDPCHKPQQWSSLPSCQYYDHVSAATFMWVLNPNMHAGKLQAGLMPCKHGVARIWVLLASKRGPGAQAVNDSIHFPCTQGTKETCRCPAKATYFLGEAQAFSDADARGPSCPERGMLNACPLACAKLRLKSRVLAGPLTKQSAQSMQPTAR